MNEGEMRTGLFTSEEEHDLDVLEQRIRELAKRARAMRRHRTRLTEKLRQGNRELATALKPRKDDNNDPGTYRESDQDAAQ